MDLLPWWLQPWKWPEYAMKWLKGWQEFREAKARADKAESELEEYKRHHPLRERKSVQEDFETRVQEMMRKIRKIHSENQAKYPGRNIVLSVKREPDDDPEAFEEAMRRIKAEIGKNMSR